MLWIWIAFLFNGQVYPAHATSPKNLNTKIILINFADDPSQPFSLTEAKQTVFGNGKSTRTFFKEASENQLNLKGQIFGWVTIPMSRYRCKANDPNQLQLVDWSEAAKKELSRQGVNLGVYDQMVYVFTPNCEELCGVGGEGNEVWLSSECFTADTLAHEIAHNFNIDHAATLNCKDQNGFRVSISQDCKIDEYGDPLDVMGATSRLLSVYNRWLAGWVSDQETQVVKDSRIVTLYNSNQKNKIRNIRIPRGVKFNDEALDYFLELRAATGRYDDFLVNDPAINGVTFRLAKPKAPSFTYLIDTTPGTDSFSDASLGFGQSFFDPIAMIRFAVLGLTHDSATIQIERY